MLHFSGIWADGINRVAGSAGRDGAPRAPVPYLLAAAVAALFSTPAMAELNDNLHPFVAVSFNHEDNLLRESDEQRAVQAASDNYRTATVGLIGEAQLGRQTFQLTAKTSRVTFDRFSQLNYTGKDGELLWNWFLGNHLSGRVGATYSQTLNSFTDFHEAERNLRTRQREYADGVWRFHPSWQLRAGAARDKYKYDLASQSYNTRQEDSVALGFDFLPSTGSTIGLQVGRLKSGYPTDELINGLSVANSYRQNEVKLRVNWVQSVVTQVLFLGGWVQRKHDASQSARDDSGINARLVGTWAPRERLHLGTSLWREYTAAEGTLINSALMVGQSVNATWDVASKVSLDASAKHEKRDFAPFAGVASVSLPSSAYQDTLRNLSTGVTYRPIPTIALNLNVFRETRDGSLAANSTSYKANGVSFTASGQF